MARSFKLGLALASFGLAGCTQLDYALGAIPWFSTMRESVYLDPYEYVLTPAPGTVPVAHPLGNVPAPITQAQLDSVQYVNPLTPTQESVARGEIVFVTHCQPCHSKDGGGNGPVVYSGGFPNGPAVNGATTAARSDSYLYNIVRVGRGLMPGYGSRISHEDRWAAVNYLRVLQARTGARAPLQMGAVQATPGQGREYQSPAQNRGTVPEAGEVNSARGDIQQNATNPDAGASAAPSADTTSRAPAPTPQR